MKAKRLLALLLAIYCVIIVGCKKEDNPNARKIVSTQEIVYYDDGGFYHEHDWFGQYIVIIEVLFDDARMMYFVITSPTTVAVVDSRMFYYEESQSGNGYMGYVYRGDEVVPSEIKHLGETYSVTETWSFGASTSLRSLVLPNSVTSVGGAYQCPNLTSVVFGNSVAVIDESAFASCVRLSYVELPKTLTEIRKYAFYDSGLTSIAIPSSVTSIGNFAFANCANLTTITCLSLDPPTLLGDEYGIYVYYNTPLEVIRVPIQSVEAYKTARGWSIYADIIVGF